MPVEHSRSSRTRHSHLPGRLRPLERRPSQPTTTLPAWDKVIRVIGFSAPVEILDPTRPYRGIIKDYFDARSTEARGLGSEKLDAFRETYVADIQDTPSTDQIEMRRAYNRVKGYIAMVDSRFPTPHTESPKKG